MSKYLIVPLAHSGLKYDVTLTSTIFSELIMFRADITQFSVYIYGIYIFHLKIWMNDFIILANFLQREIILLFPCS